MCTLDRAGIARCNEEIDRYAPGASARDSVTVTAGAHHACATTRDAAALCWGDNTWGQAAGGGATARAPVPVAGLDGVSHVTAGSRHTCASRRDGSLWCWGENGSGQIGDGTTDDRKAPTRVPGLDHVAGVAPADGFTCAWTDDGAAWCWGDNHAGQLGDGTTQSRLSPVRVRGLAGVVEVAAAANAGWSHACARVRDGSLWCWGNNEHGQLGDGTTTPRLTPVRVRW
jgi:alpha-tubulin suppressor-like RCC1 family protein